MNPGFVLDTSYYRSVVVPGVNVHYSTIVQLYHRLKLYRTVGVSSSQHTGTGIVAKHCTILPPSENSFPKSQMNRENSGISPKRHRLRILLNESYLSMYSTKYGRHHLNVHN